ncbi:I78 family peptidase inhibitor [Celeribacter litoreus]|uniref:I78 family peptidase inhibitor n=1 Tax=Celeribacter litoreus TaxID=2876714 RepID=UPI001CCDA632|nr:I78 family peptidase inhibitor [Celeribacter litoreus]MCA0042270.1 hypothetical protein [Celeribacter litoreus]
MKRFHLIASTFLGLAACQGEAETAPAAETSEVSCGVDVIAPLIGEPVAALEGIELPTPHRIIRPGMAVTMDHNPARLNILLNEAGDILGASCG